MGGFGFGFESGFEPLLNDHNPTMENHLHSNYGSECAGFESGFGFKAVGFGFGFKKNEKDSDSCGLGFEPARFRSGFGFEMPGFAHH